MIDSVDMAGSAGKVDSVGMVDSVDTAGSVDTFDNLDLIWLEKHSEQTQHQQSSKFLKELLSTRSGPQPIEIAVYRLRPR